MSGHNITRLEAAQSAAAASGRSRAELTDTAPEPVWHIGLKGWFSLLVGSLLIAFVVLFLAYLHHDSGWRMVVGLGFLLVAIVVATSLAWRLVKARRHIAWLENELVSTLNHDLRTPLTSIRGSIGLLHAESEALSERHRTLVDIAYRNGERLTRLVNDAFFFDLPDAAGKMDHQQQDSAKSPTEKPTTRRERK